MKPQFAAVLVALLASAGTASAQGYPLKCRGPLTVFGSEYIEGPGAFAFERSVGAAGEDGAALKPGQCAWVDRAVNFEEPELLQLHGVDFPPGHDDSVLGTQWMLMYHASKVRQLDQAERFLSRAEYVTTLRAGLVTDSAGNSYLRIYYLESAKPIPTL